jgi:hypothetical protein
MFLKKIMPVLMILALSNTSVHSSKYNGPKLPEQAPIQNPHNVTPFRLLIVTNGALGPALGLRFKLGSRIIPQHIQGALGEPGMRVANGLAGLAATSALGIAVWRLHKSLKKQNN